MASKCSGCGETKDIVEFDRDNNTSNGHRSMCKVCRRAYRADHQEEIAEYNRAWRAAHPDETLAYNRKYRDEFPDRVSARHAVGTAIRCGKLERHPCEICGDTNAQAHHDNYDLPLAVRWLCPVHHAELHATETS